MAQYLVKTLDVMAQYLVKALVVLGIVVVMYIVGCSETYFGSLKTVTCVDFSNQFGADNCKPTPPPNNIRNTEKDGKFLQFDYDVHLGEVDIIFVIDNSSSMHKEHKSIARQMKGFLNQIKNLDYRLAVITTDISSSPKNPRRGASYQDGKFIRIGNSRNYFENENIGYSPSEQGVEDFISAIQRPETLSCEKRKANSDGVDLDYYYKHGKYRDSSADDVPTATACPSSDERGIYALNLALENSSQGEFFRKDAHLMAVILSDEDERSSQYFINQQLDQGFTEYAFEERDYPESLVETVYNRLGALKTFSVHSIVIPPGNSSCLQHQNKDSYSGPGSGRGYYGSTYAELSRARSGELLKYGNLLRGSVISICDRRFSQQLSRVGLFADVPRISLPCSEPEYIKMKVNGRNERKFKYDIEGRSLSISPGAVPLGSQVQVTIVCKE